MPVTVVVGGQFGSEGKGKLAHFFAKERHATVAVRVGGPNSGHTVLDGEGRVLVFRHLPTASILPNVTSVIPPGSYLSVPILLREIALAGACADTLAIDPHAWVITDEDLETERRANLSAKIGSTGTGTGAALIRRLSRDHSGTFAKDVPELSPYLKRTGEFLAGELAKGKRVIVEGTQGFGLSPLHAGQYPNCTSRDTTAAAFLSESGLSPLDVDEIVLVIRAHPIRVAGHSGPLANEITWETVTLESGSPESLLELTSVTRKVRRIARFDADVIKRAIEHNRPTCIALNHLDYIDFRCRPEMRLTQRAIEFLRTVESKIESRVRLLGFGPSVTQWRGSDRRQSTNYQIASDLPQRLQEIG